MLAVVAGGGVAALELPRVDLLIVGEQVLDELLQQLDPRLVDPVLTGDVVRGAVTPFTEIRKKLRGMEIGREQALMSGRAALAFLRDAWNWFEMRSADRWVDWARGALSNLSFSVYSGEAARRYLGGERRVLAFRDIEESCGVLAEVRANLQAAEAHEILEPRQVRSLLETWEERLLGGAGFGLE